MSAITEASQDLLDRTRLRRHAQCVVCGSGGGGGLGLRFRVRSDGGIEAGFEPGPAQQGYSGLLHGGVISSLLDGAMTNCLFAHGLEAVTAELTVRFRHPVLLARPLGLRAWIERSQRPLHVVRAEAVQDGQVRAQAVAKFMETVFPTSDKENPS